MKVNLLSTIIQWLILIGIGVATWLLIKYKPPLIPHFNYTMTGIQVIIFALSIAFTWVEVLKIFPHIKPFNCMKCMTGWTALILALLFHTPVAWLYLFVGLFAGAMFSAFKMRL